MGIAGLLQRVKQVVVHQRVDDFKGQRVAVDAASWIHKGCYACALELATGRDTTKYLNYILRRVLLLQNAGIHPILVFDGRRAPLKAETNEERSSSKQDNRELGKRDYEQAMAMPEGPQRRKLIKTATEYFQKAIITSENVMTNVINALRKRKIEFLVAPYEADAQVVWLCKQKLATAIVTEDSDILVYCMAARVRVPILFKLQETGSVEVISEQILQQAALQATETFTKNLKSCLDDTAESARMFVQICILAGCDFLKSLPGIGIMNAQKYIMQCSSLPPDRRFQRFLQIAKAKGTKVSEEYEIRFRKAEALFYHHIIFNSTTKCCEFLVPLGESFQDITDFMTTATNPQDIEIGSLGRDAILGPFIEPQMALDIYLGKRHPKSLALIVENVQDSVSMPKQHSFVRGRKKQQWHRLQTKPFPASYNSVASPSIMDAPRKAFDKLHPRPSKRSIDPATQASIDSILHLSPTPFIPEWMHAYRLTDAPVTPHDSLENMKENVQFQVNAFTGTVVNPNVATNGSTEPNRTISTAFDMEQQHQQQQLVEKTSANAPPINDSPRILLSRRSSNDVQARGDGAGCSPKFIGTVKMAVHASTATPVVLQGAGHPTGGGKDEDKGTVALDHQLGLTEGREAISTRKHVLSEQRQGDKKRRAVALLRPGQGGRRSSLSSGGQLTLHSFFGR